MAIGYFKNVPSVKSTAFVIWILAKVAGGGQVNSPPLHPLTLPQNPHAQ